MDDETKGSLASSEEGERLSAASSSYGAAAHAPHREHTVGPDPTANDDEDDSPSEPPAAGAHESRPHEAPAPKKRKLPGNNVRRVRLERMMSKAELARRANLSVLTVDRVEKGYGCRMDTKRKILEALGLSLADRVRVFGEEE
jgi:DNA-binding XRE family transcriptional regulator